MEDKQINRLEQIRDDLEELISLSAQNADKSTINLTSRFEVFEKAQQERDARRWSLLKWTVGILIILLTVIIPIIFVAGDKLHDQVSAVNSRLSVLESNDKDHPTYKELEKVLKELEKKDALFEAQIKEGATQRDIERIKNEILSFLLKFRGEGKK